MHTRNTVIAAKKAGKATFVSTLPAFSGVPTLAHGLISAINTVVDDLHESIVEDFMPIYSQKQRENINVAFDRVRKDLKRKVGVDARTLISEVHSDLQKVRV